MSHSDICIILNVGSGKRDAKSNPETILASFAAVGATCTLKRIENGAQIEATTRAAMADGFKTIVAAGGDGTICAVASVLQGSDTVMGILPCGTFNYFARSLGLPMEMEAAAKVVVAAKTRPLRIARINDSVFLNNASLGAYPAILETREDIYKRWGRTRIAAYWSVIKTLATVRAPLRLRITVDGQTRLVTSPLVFVVNNAYQLTQLHVVGADRIEDGKLVVFIAPDCSPIEMIRMAVVIGLARGLPGRKFEVLSGTDILIENTSHPAGHRLTIARDGERERLAGPYRFQVVEDALHILVPASSENAA